MWIGDRGDRGLRLGSDAQPRQLVLASLAALHAPNLGQALKKLAGRRCSVNYPALGRVSPLVVEGQQPIATSRTKGTADADRSASARI